MNQTIDLLKDMIAIPSFVDKDHNEKKVADYIFAKLSRNKSLEVEKQAVGGERYNIIAIDSDPKIILFGHTDTVLPKQQENDPFLPIDEGGKLYGLGSVDMKSGLAIMLDIALNHHQKGTGYIFSVDEEYDFKGASKLKEIDYLHPKFIINLEPTNLKVLNGCRGITEFELELFGKSAHSGNKNLGINAIETLMSVLKEFESACQKYDSTDMFSSVNLAYLHGGLKTSVDDKEVRSMGNVVPNYAKAIVEIRIGSNQISKKFIENTLTEIADKFSVRISPPIYKFFLGSLFTPKDQLKDFESVLISETGSAKYGDIGSTGYFELQIIQEKWGGSAIVFGPGPSEKSHMENEYVEIDSIFTTQKIIEKFITNTLK